MNPRCLIVGTACGSGSVGAAGMRERDRRAGKQCWPGMEHVAPLREVAGALAATRDPRPAPRYRPGSSGLTTLAVSISICSRNFFHSKMPESSTFQMSGIDGGLRKPLRRTIGSRARTTAAGASRPGKWGAVAIFTGSARRQVAVPFVDCIRIEVEKGDRE